MKLFQYTPILITPYVTVPSNHRRGRGWQLHKYYSVESKFVLLLQFIIRAKEELEPMKLCFHTKYLH
jgi:hypothetical protein